MASNVLGSRCRVVPALVLVVALAGVVTAPAAGAKPTGEPVKIGVITSEGVSGIDLPTLAAGARAAGDHLNSQNGIATRPVQIVVCNGKSDPAKEAACAQQFVDEGVVAVTGLGPTWGDNGLPVLASAGIPFVGLPISNAEFVNPVSYPITGGSAAAFPALTKYFVDKGVKKVSVIYADLAAGKLAADALIGDIFKAAGVTDVTLIPEKVGAPDFTAAVVKANENDPDVIFTLFAADDCARILQAASETGVTAAIAAPGSCAEASAFKQLSSKIVGKTVFNADTVFYKPKNAQTKTYLKALKKYEKGAAVDSFGSTTFATVMTLATICKDLGSDGCTAAGVIGALENAAGIPVFMATKLDKSNAAKLAGVPTHVYNPDQRIVKLKKGKFVDAGGDRWWNGFAS
jgi:branched-chain amino acid transport system substrate-binding protein